MGRLVDVGLFPPRRTPDAAVSLPWAGPVVDRALYAPTAPGRVWVSWHYLGCRCCSPGECRGLRLLTDERARRARPRRRAADSDRSAGGAVGERGCLGDRGRRRVTGPVRRRAGAGRLADRGRRGAANPRTRRTAACVGPAAPSRLAEPPPAVAAFCADTRRVARDAGARRAGSRGAAGLCHLNAAVEQYTAAVGEPSLALVRCLSRTVSLLTLPWDEDVQRLWRSATAHPDKCDTELSRSEQQAYDRVVRRIHDLWSYRPGVDQRRS